jgi:hypothetical protein
MECVLIFAVLYHRPVVLEYHGGRVGDWLNPINASPLSFEEAEDKLDGKVVVMFAPPGRPVFRGTKEQGVALLKAWRKAKGDKRDMQAALFKAASQARDKIRIEKGYVH